MVIVQNVSRNKNFSFYFNIALELIIYNKRRPHMTYQRFQIHLSVKHFPKIFRSKSRIEYTKS